MNHLLKGARFLKHFLRFSFGYSVYKLKGITPKHAYVSMRELFCMSNGKFNNVVAQLETSFRSKYRFKQVHGILGTLGEHELEEINSQIVSKGYYIFPDKLPEDMIQNLLQFSRITPSVPRIDNNKEAVNYDGENPLSSIYDFKKQDLFEDKTIQTLLVDESVFAVAQKYLGPRPFLDLTALWWSTANYKSVDLSKAAQLYHFDLDRIKFLKFFIYLTDVDALNGPHCYIEGSHKNKPTALRRDGRFLDEELSKYYPPELFKEIKEKAGTIIAVDTSGFHKGKPLVKGERLLFQMEFATSMFGQNYPPVKITDNMTAGFLDKVNNYAPSFSEILIK